MVETVRKARAIRREAAATFEQVLIALRSYSQPPRALPVRERYVFLVHGFFAAGPVFEPLRDHFAQVLPHVAAIDFTYPPFGTVEGIAARLARRIDALVPAGAPIDLVGHSLGGLVCRWYVQELGGHARVSRLVLMASPHAGTLAARRAPGALARALRPGSDVVSRLANSRDTAESVKYVVIAGGRDMMVSPESATAVPAEETHLFPELGHNEMLFDPTVLGRVADALK